MNNWFDITVLILLFIVFIQGYKKGMIKMAIELAIIICATIFGGQFASQILPKIESIGSISPQWANVLSYVIAFVSIAIVLSFIGQIIQRFINIINLNFINRLGGGILSMAIIMIILSIILNLILVIDRNEKIFTPNIVENSFFYEGVQAVVPAVTPYLKFDIIEEIIPDEIFDHIPINSQGIIDSTYQKRYFNTDSI